MPSQDERREYKTLIDALVEECRHGQGQILSGWVLRGVWNSYADDHPDEMPEERRMNAVLARMSTDDRELVARMLDLAYEGAVHDVLRVLHDREVPPFDDAYEGTPSHDFMGRMMTDWEWPTS
jgi:hypothetical protein